jgi:HEAT repeat protein
VRVSAAYALGRNPDPSAVPVLIEALQWDWNGYVRKGVVWALGNARDLRALPVLILALRSDITAVRLWAASALGQLATRGRRLPEISAALIEGLRRDGAAAVRSNCAWSLGQLGDHLATGSEAQACRQALKTALKTDPDLGVQDDAQIALEKWGEPEETEDSEEFDFG